MIHGRIELIEERCTSCMICARECPTWCITLTSHQEKRIPAPGARPRTENVLDTFAIDWALCMYCGICIEQCPTDALAGRRARAVGGPARRPPARPGPARARRPARPQ